MRQIKVDNVKPCPHCGNTDIHFHEHHCDEGISGFDRVYSMCCFGCGATFPNRYKLQLLIDAWNRRVQEQDK